MRDMAHGHVTVHGQRRGDAAVAGAGQFFAQHHRSERTHAAAAVLHRVSHAQEAELAEVAEQLARDLACLLPGVGVRDDALLDETPNLAAHHAQFVAEEIGFQEFEVGHVRSRVDPAQSGPLRFLLIRRVGLF